MSDYHPHERPEHERPTPSARRTPPQRVQDAYNQEAAVAPPNYAAGSQFASIIHRQVAAERAARRATAWESEPPPPLATNMPVRLRQGPGSQTAAAFYRQAAEQQRAREAAERERLESEGAGEEHGYPAPVEHAHDAHETHDRQGHEAHHQHAPTHARPVPAQPHHAAPAVHPASYARSQEAAHATAAAAVTHGVDPELLAAVLAGPGAELDARLREAVERRLGADLGAVRVHTGPEADILSEQAARMAFTVGDALIFGRGCYRPETPEGQRLLADGLAAALDHGHGAPRPLSHATTATGGGWGRHGEGVGATRPLAAAVPANRDAAATGGQAATAAHLLPLISKVYARQQQPPAHKNPPPGYVPPPPYQPPPLSPTPILGGTTVPSAAPTPEQVFAQVQPLICIPHPPKENFEHAAFCMSPLDPTAQEKVLMNLATKQFGAGKAESIVEGLYATAVIPIMVHVPNEALRRIKNVIKGYKWAPPGDEPEWAYVGNEAHRQIARNYVLTHAGDNVRVNQISIATIAKLLGGDVEHTYIDKGFLGWEPDILNVTRRQLYEIKSWRQEEEARIKRDNYIAIFAALGVEIEPGPSADIGVNGVVAGPDGYYMFMSPEPGIIIYQKRNGDYNPVPVPAQQTETEQQPESNQDFIARMQAITGLSGVALALYLLISEGSRLFPPRDLLPIP